MARPREFDEQEALNKAMSLFWHDGYERASLDHLLKAMTIQRSSFYNSFGNKRQLFLLALTHYMKSVNTDFIVVKLDDSEDGLSGIEAIFWGYVDVFHRDQDCKGCLMVNTMVEVAPHDEEVHQLIQSSLKQVEDAFVRALTRARDAKLIRDELDLRATAIFLVNTLTGMRVMGRQTFERAPFEAVVKTTLSVLDI